MSRFGADTTQVLALEDSARGLRSAQAAGIRCVVVKNSFTGSQNFTGAYCVIDSLNELPGLLARIASPTPGIITD
jgi:beta-phosphoglucomutase-like phosphatase (HAD superfamily)